MIRVQALLFWWRIEHLFTCRVGKHSVYREPGMTSVLVCERCGRLWLHAGAH